MRHFFLKLPARLTRSVSSRAWVAGGGSWARGGRGWFGSGYVGAGTAAGAVVAAHADRWSDWEEATAWQ